MVASVAVPPRDSSGPSTNAARGGALGAVAYPSTVCRSQGSRSLRASEMSKRRARDCYTLTTQIRVADGWIGKRSGDACALRGQVRARQEAKMNRRHERVANIPPRNSRRLVTTPERSRLMSRVRQRGTHPEVAVRQIVRRLGYSFAVNGKHLPGSPDIYDAGSMKAVFVHGCFWHRHKRCKACTTPKNNRGFWEEKFQQNLARDQRKVRALRRGGFSVLTVWECQLKSTSKLDRLMRRLDTFFGDKR